MLRNVLVQIGEDEDSFLSLEEASDEWVRGRISKLREHDLDSRLKLSFEVKGQTYAFATPRSGDRNSLKSSASHLEVLQDISQMWDFSGLNSPRYSSSAAIVFLRRFRELITPRTKCFWKGA